MANPFDAVQFSLETKIPVDQGPFLSRYTTFQLGGRCPAVILCSSAQELKTAIGYLGAHQVDHFLVLGEGSNVLISDDGLDQVVIRYFSNTARYERDGEDVVAEASSRIDHLAFSCVKEGLAGLEFASGIPGSLAGAVVGNAGAFGHEICSCVDAVEVIDRLGCARTISLEECGFSYRHSRFHDGKEIITRVRLRLKEDNSQDLLKERQRILRERREKHPNYHRLPCAGSFFKNIEPSLAGQRRQAAGALLDQIGAKQMSVGGASVFEKHANMIVKRSPDCSARDVHLLSRQMQEAVQQRFGISLSPEVHFIGKF